MSPAGDRRSVQVVEMEQRNLENGAREPFTLPEEPERLFTVRNTLQGVWGVARAVIIFICGVLVVLAVGLYGYGYVDSHYLAPPGAQAAPPQEIIVSKGMSVNKLSLMLEEKKLVRNAKVFKYLVDFSGYGSRIQAGDYILDGSMTMQQIMEKLTQGEHAPTTNFTVMEGSTIEQAAAQLQKQGIIKDTKKFLELCKTGKDFESYDFVKAAIATKNSSQRYYMLEGYLFPAKYEIYVGTSEEDIIKKMLDKTKSVMSSAYIARANELGFSFDQVLTLASMIEKEGTPDTFAKISAVFHNRLAANMTLGSDVTVAYAVHKTGFNLTDADVNVESPYNTRKYKGLPLGPIANPSQAAIKDALYPDQDYVKGKYLYFYLTDPNEGTVEFYKTIEEFNAGKAKAKPVWDEYNRTHGG
jgi:UPF0755 protein